MLSRDAGRGIDDFGMVRTRAPSPAQDGVRWPGNYRAWIEANDSLSDGDRTAIREQIAAMPAPPLLSVVMPVHNPPTKFLIAAVNSVRCQLYSHWELCITDDASTDPDVSAVLAGFARCDARIRVARREVAGHIARASADALARATGEFVALLDHDDLIPEHAFYMVAQMLRAHPDAAIIYSDEDKVDADNVRYGPYFKQGFNRDNLLGQNCVNHLGVFRRSEMLEAGGFLPGTEGAQDYDLTLRMLERIEAHQVVHIPHILYHWRAAEGSTALDPMAKTYAFDAGQRAIAHHLRRSGEAADVQHGAQLGVYRIRRTPAPLGVSLIVSGFASEAPACRRDAAWLQSVAGDARQDVAEVIVGISGDAARAYLEPTPAVPHVSGVTAPVGGSWPATANMLAEQATGDILLFVTAGLCPTDRHALRELAGQAARMEVGAAGGRLQRPDGSILHDGYVMGIGGVCGSLHADWPADTSGYFGLNLVSRECAAVSGHALAIRREVWLEMRMFDPTFAVGWADVDMCLRLRRRGLKIVYSPFAAFIAPSGVQMTSRENPDTLRLMHRHRAMARSDPFWNPNFEPVPGAFALAARSPAFKPWQSLPPSGSPTGASV